MDLSLLSDDELEGRLERLVKDEKERTIEVIAHLAEMHRRHLALSRGYSGLFAYCTQKLGYTADEAMRRITVARLSVKCDAVPRTLEQGEVTLSTIRALSPVLTPQNQDELLRKAAGLSFREVERLAASVNPQADKRDHVQVLSSSASDGISDLPLFSASSGQETTSRVHFGFTGSEELRRKLDRAKHLLWHKFPEGRLEDVIGQALEDLLDKRDPDRQKTPKRPKLDPAAEEQHRRYIPVWVRAEVWKRDGGCCAFTTSDGVRCGEKSALEYDHLVPWALGGPSDEPDNIRLLCRAHNQLAAENAGVGRKDFRRAAEI